jgi:glutamine amidotransferase
MTGIIDYGMGNVGSLVNMVERLGEPAFSVNSPKDLLYAKKLILPGVGSFDNGVKRLQSCKLWDELTNIVFSEKIPILCICLGMQLITKSSEEGHLKGLGWIDGECHLFRFPDNSFKIPHMGWNSVKYFKESGLTSNIPYLPRFYFVHSYFVNCNDYNDILATTEYGFEFVSMLNRANIYGTQFHPEKSHRFGMGLIESFIRSC